MIQLIVNDIELELPSDAVVAITKRVADIGNFNNRTSSFTNKFSVDLTNTNRNALGLPQMNTTSRTVYEDVSGKLLVYGVEVVSNVRIKIESVGERIELALKVDNGNLFDTLKRTKLRSISLRDYDHRWNQASIVAAKDNVWTDCYTYPLMQTGNQSTLVQSVQCKGLLPCVYVKFMLKTIAEQFGYTMTGDGYSEAMLSRLVMIAANLNNDALIQADYQVTSGNNRVLWDGTSLSAVTIQGVNGVAVETMGTVGRWDSINEAQGYTWAGNPIGGYELMLPGTYTIEISYEYTIYNVTPSYLAGIMVFRRTSGQNTIVYLNQQGVAGTYSGTETFTVTQNTISDDLLNEPSYLYIAGFSAIPGNATIDYDITFTVTSVVLDKTYYNRPLTLSPTLPDWDCGKFFKEVANFIGAAYQVDEFAKTINMFTLNELDSNKPFHVDWSNKLTVDALPTFVFALDGFGKSTAFQYKSTSQYRYLLNIANEQLPDDAVYSESDFIPMDQQDALLQSGIAYFDIWDDNATPYDRIALDGKNRIGLIRTTTGTTYTSPNQSNVSPSGNDNVLYFDDPNNYSLDWSRLYLDYYDSILSLMTPNMQQVTADFLLTTLDVQQFDFSVPVYLEQYGANFYVNEISEFTTPNDVTRCTLVKI